MSQIVNLKISEFLKEDIGRLFNVVEFDNGFDFIEKNKDVGYISLNGKKVNLRNLLINYGNYFLRKPSNNEFSLYQEIIISLKNNYNLSDILTKNIYRYTSILTGLSEKDFNSNEELELSYKDKLGNDITKKIKIEDFNIHLKKLIKKTVRKYQKILMDDDPISLIFVEKKLKNLDADKEYYITDVRTVSELLNIGKKIKSQNILLIPTSNGFLYYKDKQNLDKLKYIYFKSNSIDEFINTVRFKKLVGGVEELNTLITIHEYMKIQKGRTNNIIEKELKRIGLYDEFLVILSERNDRNFLYSEVEKIINSDYQVKSFIGISGAGKDTILQIIKTVKEKKIAPSKELLNEAQEYISNVILTKNTEIHKELLNNTPKRIKNEVLFFLNTPILMEVLFKKYSTSEQYLQNNKTINFNQL